MSDGKRPVSDGGQSHGVVVEALVHIGLIKIYI